MVKNDTMDLILKKNMDLPIFMRFTAITILKKVIFNDPKPTPNMYDLRTILHMLLQDVYAKACFTWFRSKYCMGLSMDEKVKNDHNSSNLTPITLK